MLHSAFAIPVMTSQAFPGVCQSNPNWFGIYMDSQLGTAMYLRTVLLNVTNCQNYKTCSTSFYFIYLLFVCLQYVKEANIHLIFYFTFPLTLHEPMLLPQTYSLRQLLCCFFGCRRSRLAIQRQLRCKEEPNGRLHSKKNDCILFTAAANDTELHGVHRFFLSAFQLRTFPKSFRTSLLGHSISLPQQEHT